MNLFDSEFSAIVSADMYRAQVAPDLYPDERPMRLENWHPEDLAAFVGGEYTA